MARTARRRRRRILGGSLALLLLVAVAAGALLVLIPVRLLGVSRGPLEYSIEAHTTGHLGGADCELTIREGIWLCSVFDGQMSTDRLYLVRVSTDGCWTARSGGTATRGVPGFPGLRAHHGPLKRKEVVRTRTQSSRYPWSAGFAHDSNRRRKSRAMLSSQGGARVLVLRLHAAPQRARVRVATSRCHFVQFWTKCARSWARGGRSPQALKRPPRVGGTVDVAI